MSLFYMNGMLWIRRTGAPLRDLLDCYGAWKIGRDASKLGTKLDVGSSCWRACNNCMRTDLPPHDRGGMMPRLAHEPPQGTRFCQRYCQRNRVERLKSLETVSSACLPLVMTNEPKITSLC